MLGRSKPKQLVEKIDDNLSDHEAGAFNEALDKCDERGYGYAISNSFFELWLLLHHDDATEDDEKYAVTEEHAYKANCNCYKILHKYKNIFLIYIRCTYIMVNCWAREFERYHNFQIIRLKTNNFIPTDLYLLFN